MKWRPEKQNNEVVVAADKSQTEMRGLTSQAEWLPIIAAPSLPWFAYLSSTLKMQMSATHLTAQNQLQIINTL